MATPVKIIPTLHGEAARAFIERAEERERNPHPTPIYTERFQQNKYRKRFGYSAFLCTFAPDNESLKQAGGSASGVL